MPKLLPAIPDPTPDSDLGLQAARTASGWHVSLRYADTTLFLAHADLTPAARQALRAAVRELLDTDAARAQLAAAGFAP